jgi:DNA repair protein RecN (Recombination protein N)
MLRELHVQNLAVLAGAEVELGPGFNVLTGETGAGKSIVLDAVALLAGGRARADLIRSGAASLSVTGVFEPGGTRWREVLAEAGFDGGFEAEPDADASLLVRREIHRDGRNRVFVNDRPATLKLLVDLAPGLLRMHGQREELGLVAPDLQRAWLDRSGGDAARAALDRVARAYEAWKALEDRRARAAGEQRLWQERLDLVRYQLSEIEGAKLVAGEDQALRAERDVLRNVEQIGSALGAAVEHLQDAEGAVLERLSQTAHQLGEIAEWEGAAREGVGEIEELSIRLSELASALRHRLDAVEPDPRRLDAVEDRLATIERLAKKYGGELDSVIARGERLRAEREELLGDSLTSEEVEQRTAAALDEYRRLAQELSAARRRWGADLGRRVAQELSELSLPRASFEVALEDRSPGRHGSDQVTFLFSPNPGETPRPLGKVASGGELSRVYLALLLAAGVGGDGESSGDEGDRPTLIFDEIDAGLGGAEGFALGSKLRRLARQGQVLAVTHLPQVASQGDVHFRVNKRVAGDRTFAEVSRLAAEDRVEETARMLSGARVTESSLSHARELLTERGAGTAAEVEEPKAPRRSRRDHAPR